jgi:SAM-dependent methyltransferase
MRGYALLILPAANRVYAQAAPRLTLAELEVFNRSLLGGRIGELEETSIAGVPYATFSVEALGEREAALLANLSSIYALFERDGELLRPVPLRRLDRFDDDLVTIQRYQGKTNEQFTKLLLNVTLCATAFAGELLGRRFRVMDPLCGRGTTLNQALLYGFDAAGMDVDARDFDAYAGFIQTWLKNKRLKHQASVAPVRRHHRTIGRRLQVTLAATREAYRAGDAQDLEVVNADTTQALEFFRRGAFDVLVADLPYGVQHGSRTAERGLRRGPAELLAAALRAWTELLRPGGAVGVSWNTHVARRDQLTASMASAGLQVLDGDPYGRFQHRVDQAIVRDVLVARRPERLRTS